MIFSKPEAVYFYDPESDVSSLESETPVTIETISGGETEVLAPPGVGRRIGIRTGSIHNGDTTTVIVSLLDGSGGAVVWKAMLSISGGGSVLQFGQRGLLLTPNNPLIVDLGAPGLVYVNITDYYIA